MCAPPHIASPPESFSLSELSTLNLQQFIRQLRFSYSDTVFMYVSALVNYTIFFVSTCLLFQVWGQQLAPWPYFFDGSKNSCWSFSVVQFFTCCDRVATSNLFSGWHKWETRRLPNSFNRTHFQFMNFLGFFLPCIHRH